MINTDAFITEWTDDNQLWDTFDTAYDYALYLCGGDFSQFDDVPKLGVFFDSFEKPQDRHYDPIDLPF